MKTMVNHTMVKLGVYALPRDGSNTVTGSCVCQWLL